MVFSLFTISIATVEMKTIADSDGEQTFIEKLSQLFKTASINVPTILFKTGSLALSFATLKFGGFIPPVIFLLMSMLYHRKWLNEDYYGREFLMAVNGYFGYLGIFLVNIITNFFPKSREVSDKNHTAFVRVNVWSGFIINYLSLTVTYILCKTHPEVTRHCELPPFLREHYFLVIVTLATLGLACSIAVELSLRFDPTWIGFKFGDLRVPANESEDIEMTETHGRSHPELSHRI